MKLSILTDFKSTSTRDSLKEIVIYFQCEPYFPTLPTLITFQFEALILLSLKYIQRKHINSPQSCHQRCRCYYICVEQDISDGVPVSIFFGGQLGIPVKYTQSFHYHNVLHGSGSVSYTHLRAHETPEHLVCRLLLEKIFEVGKHEGRTGLGCELLY